MLGSLLRGLGLRSLVLVLVFLLFILSRFLLLHRFLLFLRFRHLLRRRDLSFLFTHLAHSLVFNSILTSFFLLLLVLCLGVFLNLLSLWWLAFRFDHCFLFLFLLDFGWFFGSAGQGLEPHVTEDFIVVVKDVPNEFAWGNEVLFLPDELDVSSCVLVGVESLVLLDLFVEFDDVGEEFLDILGAVGGAKQIEPGTGDDSELYAVLALLKFGVHGYVVVVLIYLFIRCTDCYKSHFTIAMIA